MPQQTLTTAWLVVKHSPESDKFPTAYVEPHIYPKEQTLRRQYLGKDFYDAMLADKVDYGVVPVWASSGTYSSGDYVDYFGTTLQSIQDDNTTEPCADPEDAYWVEPDLFETACYQSLWELYLRDYISRYVMIAALPHATFPSGGKGVIEWVDDGSFRNGAGTRSASQGVLSSRLFALQNEAEEILKNMTEWMNDQNTAGTCDFSDALVCAASSPTPQRRRIAYRSNYNDGYY